MTTITEFIDARAAGAWSAARDRELLAGLDESRGTRGADAMRAILAEHRPVPAGYRGAGILAGEVGCATCHVGEDGTDPAYPCATVRHLAAIDRDHPEFDPSWTPETADAT
jgi:hypothetical protein